MNLSQGQPGGRYTSDDCLSANLLAMVVVWPNEAKIGNSTLSNMRRYTDAIAHASQYIADFGEDLSMLDVPRLSAYRFRPLMGPDGLKGVVGGLSTLRPALSAVVQDSVIGVATDDRLQKHSREFTECFLHLSAPSIQRGTTLGCI
jgi:hypothetical protein